MKFNLKQITNLEIENQKMHKIIENIKIRKESSFPEI